MARKLNDEAGQLYRQGKAAEAVKCDLTVDPGETLTCQILDPEGKPVTGAFVHGYDPLHFWTVRPLPGATFTLDALRPKQPRWLRKIIPLAYRNGAQTGSLSWEGGRRFTASLIVT